PVGELAAYERVRPPSMTRTVSGLEELGLVVREPHSVDRRLAVVRITEAGLARTEADRKRRNAWLTHRLRELTPAERENLLEALPVLEKLARSLVLRFLPFAIVITACTGRACSCPTSARGCSASPRTGSSCRCCTAAARRSASRPDCSSCRSCWSRRSAASSRTSCPSGTC